jgi:hypothetical protein
VAQVTARRDEQGKLLVAAKAEMEKKTAEHKAAVAAAEPLNTAAKAAAEALAAANSREAAMKTQKTEGDAWQQALQAQLTGLEPSLQKLNAELQIINSESLVARKQAETALEPLGRFVSFSRHVAPIFAERCIACHNTRSPGGRLNLDSFAALSKGGEAGPALTAHKSAESLLLTMIQDGSMPKDADPLKPEEIAIVKQWIDVGAPLDAGVPSLPICLTSCLNDHNRCHRMNIASRFLSRLLPLMQMALSSPLRDTTKCWSGIRPTGLWFDASQMLPNEFTTLSSVPMGQLWLSLQGLPVSWAKSNCSLRLMELWFAHWCVHATPFLLSASALTASRLPVLVRIDQSTWSTQRLANRRLILKTMPTG